MLCPRRSRLKRARAGIGLCRDYRVGPALTPRRVQSRRDREPRASSRSPACRSFCACELARLVCTSVRVGLRLGLSPLIRPQTSSHPQPTQTPSNSLHALPSCKIIRNVSVVTSRYRTCKITTDSASRGYQACNTLLLQHTSAYTAFIVIVNAGQCCPRAASCTPHSHSPEELAH